MDADGRFVVGSDEFVELIGPRTTAAFGRLWSEIAAELKLDPDDQVARAVATRETWSGITVSWPVDDGGERLPVELSGLPVFDRDRELSRLSRLRRLPRHRPHQSVGARAPRTPDRIHAADRSRRSAEIAAVGRCFPVSAERRTSPPQPDRLPERAPVGGASETGTNEAGGRCLGGTTSRAPSVASRRARQCRAVSFRKRDRTEAPSLSPVERKAFRELAQELTARLGPECAKPAVAERRRNRRRRRCGREPTSRGDAPDRAAASTPAPPGTMPASSPRCSTASARRPDLSAG